LSELTKGLWSLLIYEQEIFQEIFYRLFMPCQNGMEIQKRRGEETNSGYAKPHGRIRLIAVNEALLQPIGKMARRKRPQGNGQKGKSHEGSNLPRRGERTYIFVEARRLQSLADGVHKQSDHGE